MNKEKIVESGFNTPRINIEELKKFLVEIDTKKEEPQEEKDTDDNSNIDTNI